MTTWIISADPHLQALVDLARPLAGPVVLVDVGCGPRAGVDRVVTIAAGSAPAEALAPAVVAAVPAQPGDVVLVRNAPAERVLAGAVAAALDAPVLTDVKDLSAQSATVARFGGIALEQVTTDRVRVVLADGGAQAEAADAVAETGPADRRAMTVTDTRRGEAESVDLTGARRIVSVGLGFRSKDDLALADRLAAAIGAEVGCSRPVAEGQGWLPRESYIGVTGAHVAPDLYVALGISGQLQHMAGVRGAKTIVAVNSDPNAPVFAACDYGVVGDLYEVVPALVDQIGRNN
jgi:electron transfer flavoprotein alpha subunit